MSTGLECQFHERKPGEWYYILQDWECPVGAWDWREHATAYGPFGSRESALAHLRGHHANPGGYSVTPHGEYREDSVLKRLFGNGKDSR